MAQNNNVNNNNSKYQNAKSQNHNSNQKQNFNGRKEKELRPNVQKNNRNEFQKRSGQGYGIENRVARIVNQKREESVEDIKIDIEKLEKDVQFEIRQIQSIKLGL